VLLCAGREPQRIAAFVWECLESRRFEARTTPTSPGRKLTNELGLDDSMKLTPLFLIVMNLFMTLVRILLPMEPGLTSRLSPTADSQQGQITDYKLAPRGAPVNGTKTSPKSYRTWLPSAALTHACQAMHVRPAHK
jgi:hypothetical protein